MSKKIIFIIGGARSGKSSFALNEASKIKGQKAYIATAEALDDEMKERIERHKKVRGEEWDTYEEPIKVSDVLSDIKDKYRVIVLDCLTIWLSNILGRRQKTEGRIRAVEKSIQQVIEELKTFKNSSLVTPHSSLIYIVSNEVGMGIVPDNEQARMFRDLAGSLNQKVAELAHDMYLVTAGIPIKIKN